jgi:hypothetical protein
LAAKRGEYTVRHYVYIAGTAIGWVGIAIFVVLILRDIFILDDSLSKGQMLLRYWPVIAVAVVAGVVGDLAKRTDKQEGAGEDSVGEETAS